jgi:hypothetical protein
MLPREEHALLSAARAEQRTLEWKQTYNMRAGHRRHFFARCAVNGSATSAIPRSSKDTSSESGDRLCNQPPTDNRLLERRSTRTNTHSDLCSAWPVDYVTEFANSIEYGIKIHFHRFCSLNLRRRCGHCCDHLPLAV